MAEANYSQISYATSGVLIPSVSSIGILFNIAIIAIVTRKRLRKTNFGTYMGTLALTDVMLLVTLSWGQQIREDHFSESDTPLCKAHTYLYAFAANYESFLLVNIALERFVAIRFPYKFKKWFSVPRARVGVAVTAGVCLILSTPPLIYFRVKEGKCTNGAGSHLQLLLSRTLAVVGLSGVTLIVLFGLSVSTIYKIVKQERQVSCGTSENSISGKKKSKLRKMNTIAILLVPVTYFILKFPFILTLLYENVSSERSITRGLTDPTSLPWLLRCIGEFCLAFNSSINIFLYSLKGSLFRNEIRSLYRAYRAKHFRKPNTTNKISPKLGTSSKTEGNVSKSTNSHTRSTISSCKEYGVNNMSNETLVVSDRHDNDIETLHI